MKQTQKANEMREVTYGNYALVHSDTLYPVLEGEEVARCGISVSKATVTGGVPPSSRMPTRLIVTNRSQSGRVYLRDKIGVVEALPTTYDLKWVRSENVIPRETEDAQPGESEADRLIRLLPECMQLPSSVATPDSRSLDRIREVVDGSDLTNEELVDRVTHMAEAARALHQFIAILDDPENVQ